MAKRKYNSYVFKNFEDSNEIINNFKIKEFGLLKQKFKKLKRSQQSVCDEISGRQPLLCKMLNFDRYDTSVYSLTTVLKYSISISKINSKNLNESEVLINNYKIIIGNRIVQKLKKINVSQQYFATHVKTTQSRIGYLMNTKTFDSFSLTMLIKYAITLGVKCNDYPTK